ncbi:hypothetical protein [Companilactobacillus sp. HBUAS59699]|uniref:hypothetical protein n=1 Tax=Companilactobacillus sp. HBUAS59699 TaxID=3109358 RepID=UPI002FF0483C
MESVLIVYLAIYRLVNWTTWKTTGFQARPKTKTEAGPRTDGIIDHPQRQTTTPLKPQRPQYLHYDFL